MDNFREVYKDICKSCREKLEQQQKNCRTSLISFILIAASITSAIALFLHMAFPGKNGVYMALLILFAGLSSIIFVGKSIINGFGAKYKNVIINEILKRYDKNLLYRAIGGVTLEEYHKGFKDDSEELNTEDYIYGITENGIKFKMSQIEAFHEEETTDENGVTRTEEVIDYRGVYGFAQIKYIAQNFIYVAPDRKINRFQDERVELEMAEFENDFDVFADNKIYLMKVFKPNVIEEFAKLKEKGIKKLELIINRNMIYFRYAVADIFKPPVRKDVLDEEVILSYVNTIEGPLEIINTIEEAIRSEMEV